MIPKQTTMDTKATDNGITVEEIDMSKLSRETEVALADYELGDPLKDTPKESPPFVQLRIKGEKLAGTLLGIRENVTKYNHTVYDFELIPSGKRVTLVGTDVLNRIAKSTGADGKSLLQVGRKYCVIAKGKTTGKDHSYYDYDICPLKQ